MKSLADLKALREQTKKRLDLRDGENDYRIVVGMATCGIAAGARPVLNTLVEPIVEVFDKEGNKTTYAFMTPAKAEEVVKKHIGEGTIVEEYTIGASK